MGNYRRKWISYLVRPFSSREPRQSSGQSMADLACGRDPRSILHSGSCRRAHSLKCEQTIGVQHPSLEKLLSTWFVDHYSILCYRLSTPATLEITSVGERPGIGVDMGSQTEEYYEVHPLHSDHLRVRSTCEPSGMACNRSPHSFTCSSCWSFLD